MRTGIKLWSSPRFMIDVFFLRDDNRGFCLCIFSTTFSLNCLTAKQDFGYLPGHGWYSGEHPQDVERRARLEKDKRAKVERKARRAAKAAPRP